MTKALLRFTVEQIRGLGYFHEDNVDPRHHREQERAAVKYQVMMEAGSTFPDTSATDEPFTIGPLHDSEEAAELWMEAEGKRTTSNREYYEEYWIAEVTENV